MAVTVSIPAPVWSARLLANYYNNAVVVPLFTNEFEGDVANFGSSVRISSFTDDITLRDYTQNTNMNAPDNLTTTTQDLTIDQRKYFHFQLDDVDRIQIRPEIIDRATNSAARALSYEADKFAVSKLTASGGATDLTHGVTKAQTDAGWAKDQFSAVFTLIRNELYKKLVPVSSATWVVSPRIATAMEKGLIKEDLGDLFQANLVNPGSRSSMDVSNGFWGSVMGVNVVVSQQAGIVGTSNTVPDNTFVITPSSAAFVTQIDSFETYRPELRFGDAYKGLMVYGSKVLDATRLLKLSFPF